jgi:Chalcone isomerase-like
MKNTLRLAIFALWLVAGAVPAREIAGVSVPESVTPPGQDTALALNGAGVRTKFFFKIYVGALYLPKPLDAAEAVLDFAGPSSVRMFFLYHEVSAAKLVDAWNEGFAANLSADALKALQPRIAQFNALFHTVHRGDVVRLDYLPDTGTQVWINDELRGTVAGVDFHRALLAIWLGAKPADGDLKEAMLGGK